MRVTICQCPGDADFGAHWPTLVDHVRLHGSHFVLLPELAFCVWLPDTHRYDATAWEAAVAAHDRWEGRFIELAPARLAGTRPVDFGNERYEEAFVWSATSGLAAVHAKSRMRDDEHCHESVWFHPPAADFTPLEFEGLTIGFLIGAEIEADTEAGRYRREAVQLLLTPQAGSAWFDQSLSAGREAARRTAAFELSSGRGCPGWIADPRGDVVAATSASKPLITVDLPIDAPTVD
jgi:predicted amidohydrolase